jgi:hypothetical protein
MVRRRYGWALLSGLLLAGCAGLPQINYLTEVRYPAQPADYPITITGEGLLEPHQAIAVVRTRHYPEWSLEQSATAELRRAARELGGDAVIGVKLHPTFNKGLSYNPSARKPLDGRLAGRYYYTGTVVRVRRHPASIPSPPGE